jgi:uncharacterized protein (TIRG00374 family)
MEEDISAEPISPAVKKWIVISAVLGYTVLLAYLFYFVGIEKLVSVIGSVNLGIYTLVIISMVVSLTFHTLVWYQLLSSVSLKLGFRRTYVLYWVGVFVDNLIPGGWSGDLFKAYLLSRDPHLDSGKAVASVVAKNVYEAIFNLGSMILGLILLFFNYGFEGSLLFSFGGIMLLLTLPLIILLIISFKPEGARRLLSLFIRFFSRIGRSRWNSTKFRENMEKTLDDYHNGMKLLLENPKMLSRPMILSFFAWGFEVVTLLLVFASLGQLIPLDKVIIVRSIAGNVESQGYAFAGYAQIVTAALYNNLGITIALSASVALLGGTVIFWLKTGISYVAFHCTVFSPCANFVCRSLGVGGVAGNKTCKSDEKTNKQD